MPTKTTRMIQSSPLTFGFSAGPKVAVVAFGVLTNVHPGFTVIASCRRDPQIHGADLAEGDVDGFPLGNGEIAHQVGRKPA